MNEGLEASDAGSTWGEMSGKWRKMEGRGGRMHMGMRAVVQDAGQGSGPKGGIMASDLNRECLWCWDHPCEAE